jgi:hypothetical protein
VEICGGVTCHEHGDQAGILLRVGVLYIAKLEIQLEAAMTLVSPQLQPNLPLRNDSAMCGEA